MADEERRQSEEIANATQNVILSFYILERRIMQTHQAFQKLFSHDRFKKIGHVESIEMVDGKLIIKAHIDKKE
jgi:hypothetical protein